jgi:murein DD-endopeptidase MepM/ murein hydrolase activator NlpD
LKFALLFLFFILVPVFTQAEWVLHPEKMINGGVSVLRWQGKVKMDVAVAHYEEESFFLDRDKEGLFALIGVDVLKEPGVFPVEIAGIDVSGENHFNTLYIEIVDAERKTDYLTLPPEMVTPKDPATVARIDRESLALKKIFGEDSGPFIGGLFKLPVPDVISSSFGTKRVLNGTPKSPHSGTDFRSPLGRIVRAPANSRVAYVGDLYYTGNTVILDHGSSIFSLYAHLLKPLCKPGQEIDAGQPIGKVGSTGRSTGAHLHWTIKIRGDKVDPMELLARYGVERP